MSHDTVCCVLDLCHVILLSLAEEILERPTTVYLLLYILSTVCAVPVASAYILWYHPSCSAFLSVAYLLDYLLYSSRVNCHKAYAINNA
jgi:hypothetical protein